ncbi:MAG: ribonuclease E inhibitor RraB [Pseudomonadota bacterium]
MRRRFVNQFAASIFLSLVVPRLGADEVTPPNNVQPALVDWLFEDATSQRQLDTKGPLLWSYLFHAEQLGPLESLKTALEGDGYRFKTFIRLTERSAEPGYMLVMTRVERHTVASLNARNAALTGTAERHRAAYRYMDVAAAP